MDKFLQRSHVLEWMTKRKTIVPEEAHLENRPNNYRPITSLPMMKEILTARIREEIYNSLTSCGLLPEEQKGCRKGPRGLRELLYINQHILNESKTRQNNRTMTRSDYKKGIWCGPARLDIVILQNVQNSRWTRKLYWENHENPEGGIDSRRENKVYNVQ